MKKTLSVLCLFAMLLSLAAVMTVGTSAQGTNGETDGQAHAASYAYVEPTIDGEIDDVWKDTTAMKFKNNGFGYIKALWKKTSSTTGAIYLLADVNNCERVDFLVATRFHTSTGKGTWTWGGNYGLTCTADTDSSVDGYVAKAADFMTKTFNGWSWSGKSKVATEATVKAKAKEGGNGFVAEVMIPITVKDEINNMQPNTTSTFGLGAIVDYVEGSTIEKSEMPADNCVGITTTDRNADLGIKKSPYALYNTSYHCSHVMPVSAVKTEPTLTTKGVMSNVCGCGTAVPDTEIPVTTIQWLGHQVQETIPAGATTTSMRLVSQIKDLEAFSSVGYEISATMGTSLENMTEVGKLEAEMDVVYKSIKAGSETVSPENGGEYLAAIVVKDIPRYAEDGTTPLYVTFTVKPYTVNPDGTTRNYITGTNSFTFTLKAGQPAE